MIETVLRYVQVGSLYVKVWHGIIDSFAVNIILGTPFIDWYIREIFSGERRMVPWHSSPVSILAKTATIGRRPLSSAETSRRRIPHDNAVMRTARKVALKAFTKTCFMVSSLTISLPYLELAHYGNQYQHRHTAPAIVNRAQSQTFYIPDSINHTKRVHVQKGTVVVRGTEPPSLIVNVPQLRQDREQSTGEPFSSGRPLIASVHYELAKDWKAQMTQQKAAESEYQQRLTDNWDLDVSVAKTYSKYRNAFSQMLVQLPSMWDGHFGIAITVKHRIEFLTNLKSVHLTPYRAGSTVLELQRIRKRRCSLRTLSSQTKRNGRYP